MVQDEGKQELVQLRNKKTKTGELLMKIEFLPAGNLTIQCIAGRNLLSTETVGNQDPYCVFITEGLCQKTTKRTRTDQDGGTDPQWDETLEISVVDQYSLVVECWDKDALSKDDLIGKSEVSLLPIFKKGFVDEWVPIHAKSKWGGNESAGELHLIFEFVGPPGVAYPQHQPTMDSFDDSERVNVVRKRQKDAADQAKKEAEEEKMRAPKKPGAIPRSDEFSDEEILNAFRFIDLDKNMFIGAAEIRHVLICMGELITDEEVDMMISMVDSDGDGQVSYQEFYLLVTDPDPGRPDFNVKESVAAAAAAAEGVEVPEGTWGGAVPAPPGAPSGAGAPTSNATKAKEAELKRQKKQLLSKFTEDNHLRIDT
eukprot:g2790.t1